MLVDKIILYIKNYNNLDPDSQKQFLRFLGCIDIRFVEQALKNLANYTKVRRYKKDLIIYWLISDRFLVPFAESCNVVILSNKNDHEAYNYLHLNSRKFKYINENKRDTAILSKSQYNIIRKLIESDNYNRNKLLVSIEKDQIEDNKVGKYNDNIEKLERHYNF